MQQDLSATLEEKQGNTQKLQQSIDIIESDIERISEIKQKVSSSSLEDLWFHSCLFLRETFMFPQFSEDFIHQQCLLTSCSKPTSSIVLNLGL